MSIDPVTALSSLADGLIKRIWPDPNEAAKAKNELTKIQSTGDLAQMQAYLSYLQEMAKQNGIEIETQGKVVVSESQGESWLQRNWRPLVMVWFAVLVGAHWFGLTPENLTEAEVLSLLALVKIGIGGYVTSRGIEKTAKIVAPAVANMRRKT